MTQEVSQKPTVLFNKGLVTEAGELTFPEGASVDELNMVHERSGSVRRRLGIEYETGAVIGPSLPNGVHSSAFIWENAGGVAGLNFAVIQLGATLHFYQETTSALSASKHAWTLDLNTLARPDGFGPSTVEVQSTNLQGFLVIASSEINTAYISYDDDADTFAVQEIQFLFRDFKYQGDVTTYDTQSSSATVSPQREYDTLNCGWNGDKGSAALAAYVSNQSAYPPLGLPWYSGKNSSGTFSMLEFLEIYTGTSLTTNGSFILDLYEQDRETVSGVTGVEVTPETSRFKTVASYAGRVFYSGMSNENSDKVYFSQIIYQNEAFGHCYQRFDPTSEEISDLVDTDGGVIQVNGAYNIKKLHTLGPFLLVFAENGVWVIRGVDDVFRATEYSISNVTRVGLDVSTSFVSAEGRPYWWSRTGIHTIVSQDNFQLAEKNLSIDSIQTYWGDMGPSKRQQVKVAYDGFNNRIIWLYPDFNETVDFKLTKGLVFDENLSAFYPWSFSEADSEQYILAPMYLDGKLTDTVTFNVIDSNGDYVVDASGNTVVVDRQSRNNISSRLTFLVRDTTGGVTFAQLTNTLFEDWGSADYLSFIETGYDFTGDLHLRKSPKYFTPYFEVTEEGFSSDDYIRPSSCLVSTYWDFNRSLSNTKRQAYKLHRIPFFDSWEEYPFTVITNRIKVRGGGRSYRVRFESETNKDFHLLGFDAVIGRNRK